MHDMWHGNGLFARNGPDIHLSILATRLTNGQWSTNPSTHLASFREWLGAGRLINLAEAYQLFTGVNLVNVVGNSYIERIGVADGKWAASIVEAVDHSPLDIYNADNSEHVAITAAQEIGHNAGEGEHRADRKCSHYLLGICDWWKYNFMVSDANVSYTDRGLWMTDGNGEVGNTVQEIVDYAYPRI